MYKDLILKIMIMNTPCIRSDIKNNDYEYSMYKDQILKIMISNTPCIKISY